MLLRKIYRLADRKMAKVKSAGRKREENEIFIERYINKGTCLYSNTVLDFKQDASSMTFDTGRHAG